MQLIHKLGFVCIIAQVAAVWSAAANPVRKVVVYDFALAKGVDMYIDGCTIADEVAESLSSWKEVEVIPREEVRKEMRVRNILPPLPSEQMVQLAREFDADSFVRGQVGRMQVSSRGRRIQLRLQLELIELATEVPVSGAVVQVHSVATRGGVTPAPERLLRTAASHASEQMMRGRLPLGKVLSMGGPGAIMLDIGSRHGVKTGMRFIVFRKEFDRERGRMTVVRTGEIRVTSVHMNDATAAMIGASQAINPLDKVQGIFEVSKAAVKKIRA